MGEMDMPPALPRGLRNCNVGNMEPGGWDGERGNDGRFAIFDSMQSGIRALCKQLIVYQTKYGINTIRKAISRWAPGNENDTAAYIAFVAHVCEVDPDAHLDFSDRDTLYWLVTAIGEEENGHDAFTHYVSDEVIDEGIRLALA